MRTPRPGPRTGRARMSARCSAPAPQIWNGGHAGFPLSLYVSTMRRGTHRSAMRSYDREVTNHGSTCSGVKLQLAGVLLFRADFEHVIRATNASPEFCCTLSFARRAFPERGQNCGPPKIEWSLFSVKKCLIDASIKCQ